MKRIITTHSAPPAIGPYSQAVEINGMLFISGQIPVDPATGKMVDPLITLQTKQVLENIKHILESAGYTMNDVVKCTCMLTNMQEFSGMNEIYAKYFSDDPPARATFQVAALPMGAKIEIDVLAVHS
jgi:2-iminobutanoate/2-iminopropanoate deaminase